jgi:hypothetical protein
MRRLRSTLDGVTKAKEATAAEVTRLTGELELLQAQVGPVSDIVDQKKWVEVLAKTMQCERRKMLRTLAVRASAAAARLGVSDFSAHHFLDNEGAFIELFTRLVTMLEERAASFDQQLEEEYQELLDIAGTCIFSNLFHANPKLDSAAMMQPPEGALASRYSAEVREAVGALQNIFKWRKDDELEETSGKASAGVAGKDTGDSGSTA